MKLSKSDTELFYQLMWALQFYVNQKINIHDVKCLIYSHFFHLLNYPEFPDSWVSISAGDM